MVNLSGAIGDAGMRWWGEAGNGAAMARITELAGDGLHTGETARVARLPHVFGASCCLKAAQGSRTIPERIRDSVHRTHAHGEHLVAARTLPMHLVAAGTLPTRWSGHGCVRLGGTSQGLPVVPRHPALRTCSQFVGMSQKLGQVVERIDLAQLAGVDEAHE
jgi:hypothetical protein